MNNNPYPDSEDERDDQLASLLGLTKEFSLEYLTGLNERNVYPDQEALNNLEKFNEPLQEDPIDPAQTIEMLHKLGSPATTANAGRRYYGFVIGGSQPAALAANWLAGAWDQNAGLNVTSPVSARLEDIAAKWLVRILPVASESAVGFTTGVTMANFCGLAAARHYVLKKHGWDVQEFGLNGAPQIKVVVSQDAHGSLMKAISLLGLGRGRVIKVPVDDQGKIIAEKFPDVDANTIVCLQAGNVNTGSFDPADKIIPVAKSKGAWIHVDGAFGLWAGASKSYSHLTNGYELADSWATDAHKWLNVPYDSGLVFCKRSDDLRAAMSVSGDYLDQTGGRIPYQFTPELSRKARGVEIWAALKTLGISGIDNLITRTCDFAKLFSDILLSNGIKILNDVVLNQVLVSFGSDEITSKVMKLIQSDGTCYCSGTNWNGKSAMRISISSWATTQKDIEQSADAIIRIFNSVKS
ncbi:MAG: aspartate aminotransferase family protein [Ignavibacteriales bacterium]|nr:MAG: aspartate aminotransferase family protein [Ignavibacteriales bacterium]